MASLSRNFIPEEEANFPVSEHLDERMLRQQIENMSFTPMIGGECSIAGRERSAAWEFIAGEFNRLSIDPELLEEDEYDFLESLREAKRVPQTEPPPKSKPHPRGLHDLRLELVRLGSKGGALFGGAMKDSVEAVTDITGHGVNGNGPEFEEFAEVLILACVAAHKLLSERRTADQLQSQLIYDRLIELTRKLTGGWLSERRRERLDARKDIDHVKAVYADIGMRDDEEDTRPAKIYLHQLEWFADLLWYTFRFDAQAYPSNEELAFELGLEITESDRRYPLTSAAELRLQRATEQLRRLYGYCRPKDRADTDEMSGFHDVLARYLIAQDRNASQKSADDYGNQFKAIAFSTAFDLELEDALKRQSELGVFHVAVPVLTRAKGELRGWDASWLLGTVGGKQQIDSPTWEDLPDDPGPNQLRGPLVIKLHGSPSHQLPPNCEHALTISESEYLRNFILLESPEFFSSLLSERRAFFFIGQSLADWNVRLRIYDQLYPHRDPIHGRRRVVAINRKFDEYRSASLAGFGVERWEAELRQVTRVIQQALSQ
jgi:hypothetical protein